MTDQEAEGLIRRNLIYIILLVFVFLFGLSITGWQWWQTSSELKTTNTKLEETDKKLKREAIKGEISSAIVETQRGQFEIALKDTSSFFSNLRDEVDSENNSAYTVEQKALLKPIFNERDQIIASVAKREKDSVERLTKIYLVYRNATGDARQGSATDDVGNNDIENTNTSDQNSQNSQGAPDNSDTISSNNSESVNSNTSPSPTPKSDLANVKKSDEVEKKDKNENSANSNDSTDF